MGHQVIGRIQIAHCKRGPGVCHACREASEGTISLLELYCPGSGRMQRRAIQVTLDGEQAWREYDIVKTFESIEAAVRYAQEHGIEDVEL